MIGLTKLLCGTATVAEAMRRPASGRTPPHLLQFSSELRPLVVWNVTDRCNLRCVHCYLQAEEGTAGGELTTGEARALIEDLGRMQAPVLLFSGGEPLLRQDLEELCRHAVACGPRPVLSTNGTLLDARRARSLKEAGMMYAGVSLDGAEATHDRFRARRGAWREAVAGLRCAADAGLKTGVRFTIHRDNRHDLPAVLDLVEEMAVPRFCMYHLVYSGRARGMAGEDLTAAERREAVDLLVRRVLDWDRRGVATEVLTTDQHADGVYLLRLVERLKPERVAEVRQLLTMHGGCSAGCKIADIDPRGGVHPCQFWGHVTLGNVRERPFSEIWGDGRNELLARLRRKPRGLQGRCGRCAYQAVCGGCRVRAEAAHGDAWAEDPACYLTEEEILGAAGTA